MKHWQPDEAIFLIEMYHKYPELTIPKVAERARLFLPGKTVSQIITKLHGLLYSGKMHQPVESYTQRLIWSDTSRMDIIVRLEELHEHTLHAACKIVAKQIGSASNKIYPMVKRMINDGTYHQLLLRIYIDGDDK